MALFDTLRKCTYVKILIFFNNWQLCQECQLSLLGTLRSGVGTLRFWPAPIGFQTSKNLTPDSCRCRSRSDGGPLLKNRHFRRFRRLHWLANYIGNTRFFTVQYIYPRINLRNYLAAARVLGDF